MIENFRASFQAPAHLDEPALWFVISGDKVLVRQAGEQMEIIAARSPQELPLQPVAINYLGLWGATHCYAVEAPQNAPAPAGHAFLNRFSLYRNLPFEPIFISGLARQLVHWDSNHRFCGACGGAMRAKTRERAKQCTACNTVNYPRISPAVIMRVNKGDQLLLGRSPHFAQGMYSVLAGFVEMGETLEQTVAREVGEETGIRIKNIRYFRSQPWPFPDSLMLGFTAEYESGELTVDRNELEDAGWFSRQNLPKLPIKQTIARQLIDDFWGE